MLNLLDDGDLGRVRRSIYVLLSVSIFCHFYQPMFSLKGGFLGFTPTVQGLEAGPEVIFLFLLGLAFYFFVRFYHLSEVSKRGILDPKVIDEKLRIATGYASAVEGITELLSGAQADLDGLRRDLKEWPGDRTFLNQLQDSTEKIGRWLEELKSVQTIDAEQIRECQINLRTLINNYHTYETKGEEVDYKRIVDTLRRDERLIASLESSNEESLKKAVRTHETVFPEMSGALSELRGHVARAFPGAKAQLDSLENELAATLSRLNDSAPLLHALETIQQTQQAMQDTARGIHLVKRDAGFTEWTAYLAAEATVILCLMNLLPAP